MISILITGAGGFIGRVLVQNLIKSGYKLRLVLRPKQKDIDSVIYNNSEVVVIDESKSDYGLSEAVKNIDVVIHLAARVHVMNDNDLDPLAAFRRINVGLTQKITELAIASKVKRFVFVSSLHVNGATSLLHPFTEEDNPAPSSPYALSKLEAEQYLNTIAKSGKIEVVIIRPPLVYGPYVKANFLSLLKLTKTGLPLPVGLLNSKRSMISVNNLVDFIACCIKHPKAANETFLVSDDHDLTTKELFFKLIKLFGKRPLLLPIPPKVIYILGALLGKKEIVDRLCAPLQVDITKAKTILNWQPIQILDDGLKETVEWYKQKCLL